MVFVRKWFDGVKWHVIKNTNTDTGLMEMLCEVQVSKPTVEELGTMDGSVPGDACSGCEAVWDGNGWPR